MSSRGHRSRLQHRYSTSLNTRRSCGLLVEGYRKKRYARTVMTAILRCFGMMVLLLAFIPLPLVARSVVPARAPEVKCCKNISIQSGDHPCDTQGGSPANDRQSCSACTLCLVLFFSPAAHPIFSLGRGEVFSVASTHRSPRVERPPVPPPRVPLL